MLNLQSLQPSSCHRSCQLSSQLNAKPLCRATAVQAAHATPQQLKRQGRSSPQTTTEPSVPKQQHQRQQLNNSSQQQPRHATTATRHRHQQHNRRSGNESRTSGNRIGAGQEAQGGVGDGGQQRGEHALPPAEEEGQSWDEAVYEHYDSLGYEQQLVVLRQMLTPDKIDQIQATSTPEELEQLDLVLQDVQKLSELEAAHQSSHASSSSQLSSSHVSSRYASSGHRNATLSGDQSSLASAATPPAMPQQQTRRRGSTRINVASRLAEERQMVAAAAAAAPQPSINADFYSYLQTEVFQGADGEEMCEILDTLGQAQVEQLVSVFNEMRSFVHQPPEQLAQKYAELSSHMDALMAAAPEEPEGKGIPHQSTQQHLHQQEHQPQHPQPQHSQQRMPPMRSASGTSNYLENSATHPSPQGGQHAEEGAFGGILGWSSGGGVVGGGGIGDPSWDPWSEQEAGELHQQADQDPWQLLGSQQGQLQGSNQQPVHGRKAGAASGENALHSEKKSGTEQEELLPSNGLQRRWRGRVGRARGALFPKKVS